MILAKYFDDLNTWYHRIHTDNAWTNLQIVQNIEEKLGLNIDVEPYDSIWDGADNVCMANAPEVRDVYKDTYTPIELVGYSYAILHASSYRKKDKEFKHIDFSHLRYQDLLQTSTAGKGHAQARFWKLVSLGGELRQLHLLQSPTIAHYIASYPIIGDNSVARNPTISSPSFEANEAPSDLQRTREVRPIPFNASGVVDNDEKIVGKVWINDTQYFDNVPRTTWEFHFGGHRPVQKWLMDRRGLRLSLEEILHYQKIIVAMTETHRLVSVIDDLEVGGCR